MIPETTVSVIDKLTKQPLTHAGKPVVTLAAVDALHGRSKNATSDNFNRYRDNVLQKGVHYFEAPYVEWSQWVNGTASEAVPFLPPIPDGPGGHRGPLTLLTERGYLRLIMYFEDELSKEICAYVLDKYFEAGDDKDLVQKTHQLAGQTLSQVAQQSMYLVQTFGKSLDVIGRNIDGIPIATAQVVEQILDKKLKDATIAADDYTRSGRRTRCRQEEVPETFRRPQVVERPKRADTTSAGRTRNLDGGMLAGRGTHRPVGGSRRGAPGAQGAPWRASGVERILRSLPPGRARQSAS